ncbi:glutaredoxin-C9 [Nicotiana tabacum]|uniref:Glutaredoxin-C9 n=2 Tax=Nicotiana TaxID=4085 RepID=A0A1S4A7P9_TOBAC|nr:PREDICTED: glutaredoxin-C9-like [Nicotiana sylvestris]XP_016472606.1 PREDICTED: glutaredoxin-C9-like [Nicotiana tabacum]
MQRSIPYRNWLPSTTTTTTGGSSSTTSSGGSTLFESYSGESNETYSNSKRNQDKNSGISTGVAKLVSENAIIVIATRGCCMCYVIKNLLLGLGVNPTIFEVNKEDEEDVMKELSRIVGGDEQNGGGIRQFPVVFVGGKLFGGLERVMSTHISGELIPILKEAGALWL